MKRALLYIMAMLGCMTASAQTFDADMETGAMSEGWTVKVPDSPYTGGYSVVTYASETSLKAANVGTNDIGGTYVLKSLTGAKNKVKANSDNWLISPEVTIGAKNVFTFRLAANCSYSPTKTEAEKMKMDVLVICGSDTTKLGTIAPENYFTWKQYAYDLSAFDGKAIKVAFHDYGTMGSGAIGDMKYIDNIKLTDEQTSDFTVEVLNDLHGQAEYNAPLMVRVTNYGLKQVTYIVNYSYGDTDMQEWIESDIASGQSEEMKIADIELTPGSTVTLKVSVYAPNDAITDNDSVADKTITTCPVKEFPYSICSTQNEAGEWVDAIENEFSAATGSTDSKWVWGLNNNKYHAWIYSLTKASKAQLGYLYTNNAFVLPAGKVYLQTIGTATLTDNTYEVYIAKYGDKAMVDYAQKVGQSDTLRNVVDTQTIDTTTVELNIPEAGTYVIAIRPMTQTQNAQMAIIGYSLYASDSDGIKSINADVDADDNAYNIAGQRVGAGAKGIIIRNGHKYINK